VASHNLSEVHQLYPEPEPGGSQPNALVESYRRLAEIFHQVLSEQSPDMLLERIAEALGELVPHDELLVYQADDARRRLVPVFARAKWADQVMSNCPAYGEGITGWAVLNRQPVLANDAHLDPRVATVPGTPVEPEALIAVPLIARGSLKGALNIYRLGEEAEFTASEFELAVWFGDAAALALDNAQVRARLEHAAQTDSLTGLYNHRFFHERLRAELIRATRAHDTVALLMFDIDDFKRVNDVCGHAVGDRILAGLGEIASAIVRGSDIVCRIGGEEFGIILPSCDVRDAVGLARRLNERIATRPPDEAGEITLSIGIAQGPENAMNPRELLACAEAAMMTAKAEGKNRVIVFDDESAAERPDSPSRERDVRSIAHLKMLQSLVGKLNRLIDVREIGETIVSELRMLIDYHNCRVYTVEGEDVCPIAWRGDLGVPEEEVGERLRVKVGRGITGYVAETGRSLLVPNALESEHVVQIPGTEPIDESIIAVPLHYGGGTIGVVLLSKLGLNQFDEDDLRLLEVLAGHASVALENARLYEAVRAEAENAKALLEFADAMSQAGSFEGIADEAVRNATRLLEIPQCSIWLQDPREGDFYVAASVGYLEDPEAAGITQARIGKEVAEAFIESRREPFVVSADELRRHFFPGETDFVPRAIATCPLDPGYGIRGWISVRKADDDVSHFTPERLHLLDGLAYRASAALQKARLYHEQQESAEIAAALLDFAQSVAAAEGVREVVERIVAESGRILEVPEAALWLEDVETGDVVAKAVWGREGEALERTLEMRYPAKIAARLAGASEPFVYLPEDHPKIPRAGAAGFHFAIAPFRFDGGRMGFLVAGAPREAVQFSEPKLKLLAGLANQAKLAISSAR